MDSGNLLSGSPNMKGFSVGVLIAVGWPTIEALQTTMPLRIDGRHLS
jgi:hypothetical protein